MWAEIERIATENTGNNFFDSNLAWCNIKIKYGLDLESRRIVTDKDTQCDLSAETNVCEVGTQSKYPNTPNTPKITNNFWVERVLGSKFGSASKLSGSR